MLFKMRLRPCVWSTLFRKKYEPIIQSSIHGKSKLKYEEVTNALRSNEFWNIDREEIFKEGNEKVLFAKEKLNGKRFGGGGKSWAKKKTNPRHEDIEEHECEFYREKGN